MRYAAGKLGTHKFDAYNLLIAHFPIMFITLILHQLSSTFSGSVGAACAQGHLLQLIERKFSSATFPGEQAPCTLGLPPIFLVQSQEELPAGKQIVYPEPAFSGGGTRRPTGLTLTALSPTEVTVGATAISAGVMLTPDGLQLDMDQRKQTSSCPICSVLFCTIRWQT